MILRHDDIKYGITFTATRTITVDFYTGTATEPFVNIYGY